MHPKPEIFQAEFTEIFARNCERVEIVLVQVSAKLSAAFLVFAPDETHGEKEQRNDDRSDHIDR